jgi:hypothetical protein
MMGHEDARQPPMIKNISHAERPLGRARRLGARRGRGLGGALGLGLLAPALAMGSLGGGDLGLVRAHVRDE